MRVNEVFCGVSSSGTMRSAMLVLLGNNTPHPTAACPLSVIHAGQKCQHLCGIGKSVILHELCLELVPQKEI